MNKQNEVHGEFGIRWQEVDRRDNVVVREKFFATNTKRDLFTEKLLNKDNFINLVATSDRFYA